MGLLTILSEIQPVTIDTMLNKIGPNISDLPNFVTCEYLYIFAKGLEPTESKYKGDTIQSCILQTSTVIKYTSVSFQGRNLYFV